MKKITIIAISALAFVSARAFAAEAPKAAGKTEAKTEAKTEKKAEAGTGVKAEKKDCKDCPMHKKGKMCPETKEKGEARMHEGKMCPEHQGKGDAKAASPARKYMCPMKCATSDKPGKCPKCGMEMAEVKPEAKK